MKKAWNLFYSTWEYMPTPYPQVSPSPDIIAILTEIILKNNHLSFLDRNVLKPVVTATETRASSNPPSAPYAKLFEGRIKETVWEAFIWVINYFRRY